MILYDQNQLVPSYFHYYDCFEHIPYVGFMSDDVISSLYSTFGMGRAIFIKFAIINTIHLQIYVDGSETGETGQSTKMDVR